MGREYTPPTPLPDPPLLRLALLVVVDESTPLRRATQKVCPPLGLLYLQAYLAQHAPEVEVIVTWSVAEVVLARPDLIGLSSVTENFVMASVLATRLHEVTGAQVLIGGAHISLVPGSLPAACAAGGVGRGRGDAAGAGSAPPGARQPAPCRAR